MGDTLTPFGRNDMRLCSCQRAARQQVLRAFLDQGEVHQAAGRTILEYWIPAGDLPALNASIVATIEVTAAYH